MDEQPLLGLIGGFGVFMRQVKHTPSEIPFLTGCKNIRKLFTILAGLFTICLCGFKAYGQTNAAKTNAVLIGHASQEAKSNAVPVLSEQARLAQLDAVRKAMPQYFMIDQNKVTENKTISLNETETLRAEDETSIEMDVCCIVH